MILADGFYWRDTACGPVLRCAAMDGLAQQEDLPHYFMREVMHGQGSAFIVPGLFNAS